MMLLKSIFKFSIMNEIIDDVMFIIISNENITKIANSMDVCLK